MGRVEQAEVTQLLQDVKEGSKEAYNRLFPKVYDELKHLANANLVKEQPGHTLSKTALVHEVYLKIVDQTQVEFQDRSHFFAIAARSMRQILIDYARKKRALKRGGEKKDLTYIDELMKTQEQAEELLNIDEKLDELAKLNKRLAEVVELRFFGELSVEDTACAMGISESTVKRDWVKARGWLYKELKAGK